MNTVLTGNGWENSTVAAGAEDAAAAEFWRRHLLAGGVTYGATSLLVALYIFLTPHGPNRGLEWSIAVMGVLTGLVLLALPGVAIARWAHRLSFFVGSSVFSCVLSGVAVALDHGLHSPMAPLLFLPMTYASIAYPTGAVVGIGAVAAASAGAVAVISATPFADTEIFIGIIAVLTLLAASVAAARAKQQAAQHALTDHLADLATHDGLTGCLNHRTFYARVTEEMARAARHGHGVSLLMIDIDNFKNINDACGHLVGDDVLRRVGAAVVQAGRSIDPAGRIGGDEFAVMLVETTRDRAEAVAARFRQAVAELAGPVDVRVTVGVAHLEHPTASATPQDLVSEADADLYRLKQARLLEPRPSGGDATTATAPVGSGRA